MIGKKSIFQNVTLYIARLCVCIILCLCVNNICFAEENKEGIILVAFGTTVDSAKISLDALDKAYATHGKPVLWAYTSTIIRKKLEKNDTPVFSVHEALDKAADLGWSAVRVQSLHVGVAEEFHKLDRMLVENITLHPNRFKSLILGHPLLESERDMEEAITAVIAELPKERQPTDAVLFMAHGNDRGPGDLMLYALDKAFQTQDPLMFVAAVEGSSTFEKALVKLKAQQVQRVWLQPFMIVAGDHAINDMAGPEDDSWTSQLKAAGIEVMPIIRGLGQQKGIQEIFLRHTKESTDEMIM